MSRKWFICPYIWKTDTKDIQKALKVIVLNKYKAQFEIKLKTDNLEVTKSESVTASKFKIKKAEMSETQWQVKTQEEQKKLEKLCDLKKKQKIKVKKREEKCFKSKNIDDNLTTSDLLMSESSEDEKRKTATLKAVLALNNLKSWFW